MGGGGDGVEMGGRLPLLSWHRAQRRSWSWGSCGEQSATRQGETEVLTPRSPGRSPTSGICLTSSTPLPHAHPSARAGRDMDQEGVGPEGGGAEGWESGLQGRQG